MRSAGTRGSRGWASARRATSGARCAAIVGLGPIGPQHRRASEDAGHEYDRRASQRSSLLNPATGPSPTTALLEALPGADWLILCCPASPVTRGIGQRGGLSQRCPRARISSTCRAARSPIESDVIAALQSGQLAGAYLDVFERGSRSIRHRRLWDMPNVLVSPHTASHSLEPERGDLRHHSSTTSRALSRRAEAAQRRRRPWLVLCGRGLEQRVAALVGQEEAPMRTS